MPRRVVAVLLAIGVAAAAVALISRRDDRSSPTASQAVSADCESAMGTTVIDPTRDVVLGPLVLLTARLTVGQEPNAFDDQGYKLPITLPAGVDATLKVPRGWRARLGLVYSQEAQSRVTREGLQGAAASFRFRACNAGDQRRAGWAGGFVVDRPRCGKLILESEGTQSVHRVPLGRAC